MKSNTKETLQGIGACLLYIVLSIGGLLALFFLIRWGATASEIIMPYLYWINGILFLMCIFVLIPMALIRKTRGIAGIGLYFASYIFGLSVWLSGFLITYAYWGVIGVIVGFFLAGVGVVATALLALIINAEWALFGILFLNVAIVLGVRTLGAYLAERADRESNEIKTDNERKQYCPSCSEENVKQAKYCKACGHALSGE